MIKQEKTEPPCLDCEFAISLDIGMTSCTTHSPEMRAFNSVVFPWFLDIEDDAEHD